MKTKMLTLKNGLSVILVDSDAFPSLTVLLLVGAGSRFENPQNNGIAHFFEHMAFKGSKKYPTTLDISSTVESFGGMFNAFTNKDHTGYFIKGPSTHFETIIDVIADMIQRPLLKLEEIEREKGVIVEEINMYEDNPQRKVAELFETLLYKNNSLGFDIAGTRQTVTSFTRKTFVDYINELYFPSNSVLIVAGGLKNIDDYVKIVEEKFHEWKDGRKSTFKKVVENQKAPELFIRTKKTEQGHFCIGWRAFSFRDKRRHALSVLTAVLGKGMSSKLFINVRERHGLCYYIYSFNDLYKDVGNFVTHAGVTLDAGKIKQSIEIILKQHKEVIKGEITKDELYRAKEILKGGLILSLEDSFNKAFFYGRQKLLEGTTYTPEEIMKKIDAVTKDEIIAIAESLFKNENLNMTLIGPFEDKKEFESVLHI